MVYHWAGREAIRRHFWGREDAARAKGRKDFARVAMLRLNGGSVSRLGFGVVSHS